MSRLSTVAVSTLRPALNVLSTTLPDRTFFSLVRTNAPPLPGLTCWNSMTVQSWPSILSTMPFLRSLVVATIAASCRVENLRAGAPRTGAAADRRRSYRAPGARPALSVVGRSEECSGEEGAAGHPDERRPDHRGERADDEPLRRAGVLAQLGVAPQPLDRDDQRHRRHVPRQDAPRDSDAFEDADPGATAQHGTGAWPVGAVGHRGAHGVARWLLVREHGHRVVVGSVLEVALVGGPRVGRATREAQHRARQNPPAADAHHQHEHDDEQLDERVHERSGVRTVSWVVARTSRSSPVRAASDSRRAAAGRAAISSDHNAVRSRWLTACCVMPSRAATSSWRTPGPPVESASMTAQPAAVRRAALAPMSIRTPSASAAASGSMPRTASGTTRMRLLAASTAARASTNAVPEPARADSGSGSSTTPPPIPTLQPPRRRTWSAMSTTATASAKTACTSSPTVRSNGRRTLSETRESALYAARLPRNSSTRSPTTRLPCWSIVITHIRQGYPLVATPTSPAARPEPADARPGSRGFGAPGAQIPLDRGQCGVGRPQPGRARGGPEGAGSGSEARCSGRHSAAVALRVPRDWVPDAARGQAGVFTSRQAVAEGLTAAQVRRRTDTGRWVRVVGGALAHPGLEIGPWQQAHAAWLTWSDSVVCLGTAARLHRLPVPDDGLVHVVVPSPRASRGALTRHEFPLGPRDVTRIGRAAVTTRRRTLLDCLGRLPDVQSEALTAWVLTRRLLGPDELARAIAERPGAWGNLRRRRALLDMREIGRAHV